MNVRFKAKLDCVVKDIDLKPSEEEIEKAIVYLLSDDISTVSCKISDIEYFEEEKE